MKKIFIIIFGSFALLSCNQTAEKSTSKVEVTKQEAPKEEESEEALELNNGEKWVVNEEMKPHVREGEDLVNVYAETNHSDFKKLATDLKSHNDKLIKSCTMDGKSHDELHKWLVPHLKLTKELAEETDAIKASDIVKELQYSYSSYHRYFK